MKVGNNMKIKNNLEREQPSKNKEFYGLGEKYFALKSLNQFIWLHRGHNNMVWIYNKNVLETVMTLLRCTQKCFQKPYSFANCGNIKIIVIYIILIFVKWNLSKWSQKFQTLLFPEKK